MKLLPYHDTYACSEPEKKQGHLLLLHGWGMNSLVWDELIPLLIDEFDITLIDLPGMGRSPLPSEPLSLEFLARQVLSVAPEKAWWIGWSLGALVVQRIALDSPQRLHGAMCIAGTPRFVCGEDWPYAMPLSVFEKFQALLEEDWQGTLIRFLTLQCKGSETVKEDTRKLRESVFHHGLPAPRALREGLAVLKENDLREQLAKQPIPTPITFVLGQFDTLIPQQVQKDLLQINSELVVKIIEGASHVPQLSHPDALASQIRTWVTA